MRITIETETNEPLRSVHGPSDATGSLIDGGAPTAEVSGEARAGSAEQAPALGKSHEDAGPPPAALVAAIQQAFERDPGRFDVGAASADEMADGGAAPAEARNDPGTDMSDH